MGMIMLWGFFFVVNGDDDVVVVPFGDFISFPHHKHSIPLIKLSYQK
jgi:hypothetical protein